VTTGSFNVLSITHIIIQGYDASVGGAESITFEDVNTTQYTFVSPNYAVATPIIENQISSTVTSVDCGGGDGSIAVSVNAGASFTISVVFPVEGTIDVTTVSGLSDGTYLLLISDDNCPESYIQYATILDGSLELENISVQSLQNCTSTNNTASGYLPGSITADVIGGAGSSGVWNAPTILPNVGSIGTNADVDISDIPSSGNFLVTISDATTGCSVSQTIAVGEEDVDFDLSTSEEEPIIANACSVLSEGSVSVSTSSLSSETFSYDWTPTGGSSASSATYEGLEITGTYTVTVSTLNGTCEAEADIDLTEEYCSYSDLNGDNIINTGDLQLLLASFNSSNPMCPADINNDGFVNQADLSILLSQYDLTFSQFCN